MKTITLFLFTILSFNTFARGPAVDPGRGLSIDHYDHSQTKEDPGFNWQDSKNNTETKQEGAVKKYRKRSPSSEQGTNNTLFNLLVVLMITTLPISLWFGVIKPVLNPNSKHQYHDGKNGNLVNLSEARKNKKVSHDDDDESKDDFSQAS